MIYKAKKYEELSGHKRVRLCVGFTFLGWMKEVQLNFFFKTLFGDITHNIKFLKILFQPFTKCVTTLGRMTFGRMTFGRMTFGRMTFGRAVLKCETATFRYAAVCHSAVSC